jgi:heat shock protein HslJ
MRPLGGTAWRLVAYRPRDQLMDTPPDATMTLRFDLPGVGGKSAINQYHGTVAFQPNTTEDTAERKLTLSGFASTMMAGPEPLMALEAR